MEKKKFAFTGTIIALIAIIIMVVVYKMAYKENLKQKEVIVEPTEPVTMGFLPGGEFLASPTE